MNKIPVNLGDLGNALDDGGGLAEHRWFVDLRNGELILVSEFADLPEEYEDIDEQPEVFLYVEPRSSRDGFAAMEDFVGSLPAGEASRALARSLRLPKPFRSFKDTLIDFPAEREAWFAYLNHRQREAAIEFLEKHRVSWIEAPPPSVP